MAFGDALSPPVRRFVAELTPVVSELNPKADARLIALEAFEITASFVDADGRHSDEELAELLMAFSPWLDHLVGATPSQVRRDGLVARKREWKARPSPLFEILIAHDRRAGTNDAWRYYELAMLVAHTVCSLDNYPAAEEISDLDRFRSTLLTAMKAADVVRPLRPAPADLTSAPGAAATAGAPPPKAAEPELPPPRTVEDVLAELDAMVGLDVVKKEVRLTANLLRVQKLRKERGLPTVESSNHMVFTGNPGTGKTTVARLLAQVFRALGVIDKGHLVETDRSGLVAGFVGQTAIKVREAVESALGGVLLIDEAHALARGSEQDFGREAIDQLVKMIEDHRDNLVVIAAGYPEEMAVFVEANPGLRSRFPKFLHFPDYTTRELVEIFGGMCHKGGYAPTPAAIEKLRDHLAAVPRDKGFGNARLVRNLFEAAVAQQASRVVDLDDVTDAQLSALDAADIPVP